ncbi:hypothetical protein CN586_29125 [Bacillus toyonensis]|nr:hypothetical protein CN586_29125 [Bacillus toyonensis]
MLFINNCNFKTLVHINYIKVGIYQRIKLFISPSKVIFYRNILTFLGVGWFIMQIRCCSDLNLYKDGGYINVFEK